MQIGKWLLRVTCHTIWAKVRLDIFLSAFISKVLELSGILQHSQGRIPQELDGFVLPQFSVLPSEVP